MKIEITAQDLVRFKSDAFMPISSRACNKGSFAIGVNGNGAYVVLVNKEKFVYDSPEDALKVYKAFIE